MPPIDQEVLTCDEDGWVSTNHVEDKNSWLRVSARKKEKYPPVIIWSNSCGCGCDNSYDKDPVYWMHFPLPPSK